MASLSNSPEPARWPAYARIPKFVPVPVRMRRHGWWPIRQARFIGWLAETGSVSAAAARVGLSQETAYRLRAKPGAESFVHAWDSVLAIRADPESWRGKVTQRKVTGQELAVMAHEGAFEVRMRRGRFLGTLRKPCNSALLQLLASCDRTLRGRVNETGRALV